MYAFCLRTTWKIWSEYSHGSIHRNRQAAGAVLTFPLRNSGGLSECAAVFRDLSGKMHTSGASAGRAWYGQGKRRKNIPYVADEKQQKNCRISHPREQEIWNRMGIQRRKDCTSCVKMGNRRGIPKLLPEQQRTCAADAAGADTDPDGNGKEDQRIAYCMEWMKQQGMESVHTDELGNVIWEYRPEQERRFCIRRIWTPCFRWRSRWRSKKTE